MRLQEAPYEDELLALVERGRLDFTFALVPPEGPFEHVELLRDPYVLLTQEGTPLAQREIAPTLAEIGRMPLDRLQPQHLRHRGAAALARHRAARRLPQRRERRRAAHGRRGHRLGAHPAPRDRREHPGVVALDASRRVPARQIGLAWHRDATLPEAATDFVAAVRARCDELAQSL